MEAGSAQWPEVTVVICTFDRWVEVHKTIDSLVKNLIYPAKRLRWHIADDGTSKRFFKQMHTPDGVPYAEAIAVNIAAKTGTYSEVSVSVTDRKGWGANVNAALRAVKTDYVFFTEDDYVLQRPLDLRPHVALMEVQQNVGMVRYGIAGHGVWAAVREADISRWMPEFQENTSSRGYEGKGKLSYLEIHPRMIAGAFGFYRYSNRPHLKHRRFHEAYGLYPEGLTLGQTEEAMNHILSRSSQDEYSPVIVCPSDWVLWHFDHIGASRQGSAAEAETVRYEA